FRTLICSRCFIASSGEMNRALVLICTVSSSDSSELVDSCYKALLGRGVDNFELVVLLSSSSWLLDEDVL
ncbi:hypothetical protein PENTCL1PPCAC_20024, partial [Pristionchus entomophagus]